MLKTARNGTDVAIVFLCKGATMVEHIVHIVGGADSSLVAATLETNRKGRFML